MMPLCCKGLFLATSVYLRGIWIFKWMLLDFLPSSKTSTKILLKVTLSLSHSIWNLVPATYSLDLVTIKRASHLSGCSQEHGQKVLWDLQSSLLRRACAAFGLMVNPIAENNKNWSDLAFSTVLISLWAVGPLSRCKLQVPCPALSEKHSASRI